VDAGKPAFLMKLQASVTRRPVSSWFLFFSYALACGGDDARPNG